MSRQTVIMKHRVYVLSFSETNIDLGVLPILENDYDSWFAIVLLHHLLGGLDDCPMFGDGDFGLENKKMVHS